MNKLEREEQIRHIKSEASSLKSSLIRLASALEELNKKEARRLGGIIGRLEHWQNTGNGAV